MKQKIKKPKKVKNKLTPNHSGVLLEEMNSNLKLILEDHTGLNKKIEGLDKKIDTKFDDLREEMNFKFKKVNSNFKAIFEFQKETDNNFKTVFEYLSQIDGELKLIRTEMALIKSELKRKADLNYFRDYFKNLEKRIKELEINYTELHSLVLQKHG